MAKIDTSTIKGYSDMTPEQRVAALEAYDIAETSANTQELEQKDNTINKMQSQIEQLQRELTTSKLTAEFAALGFNSDDSQKAAQAIINSDYKTLIGQIKAFGETRQNEAAKALLKNTPVPQTGTSATAVDKKEYDKMTIDERYAFYRQNPDAYKQMVEQEG